MMENPSNTQEPPSSSISSYHTAAEELPQPPSCIKTCCNYICIKTCCKYIWSLVESPFYQAEISTLTLIYFICIIAIGISLAISVEIEEATSITYSKLYWFLAVCMWISIIWLCGIIYCGGNNIGSCCLTRREHEVHIHGYLIVGITFLCIGSSFISAVEVLPFIFSLGCNMSNITSAGQVHKELVGEAVFSFTKVVFLIFQLYFFCRFSNKTFLESSWVRMFLMHIIAVNLCIWFYIIVDESVEHQNPRFKIKNCNPFKDIESFNRKTDGYLYPFSIEYSVMSSVLFFLLWFRLKPRENDEIQHRDCSSSAENSRRQGDTCCERIRNFFRDTCCKEGSPQGEKKPTSFWKAAICGYVFGVLMLVFVLLMVALFATEFKDDQKVAVYSYLGSRIAINLVMSFLCLFGLRYLQNHPPGDQTAHTIVDTALIMIGVSGCYLLTAFQVTASASDYNSCSNITTAPATNLTCVYLQVTFVDCGCSLIQFTLQAFFIVRALRRCSLLVLEQGNDISSSMVVRRCSAFLSIANIGIWVMNTYDLSVIKVALPENKAYSSKTWRILSHIAYPLCIFFRLHSVFCCCEIVINRFAVVLKDDKGYGRVPREDGPSSG